jgi:hypothetical protein
MGLQENLINGEELELELSKFFKASLSHDRAYYDFVNDKAYFEVKSCHVKIKNGKYGMRSGRFSIHKVSHELIAQEASEHGKHAIYIFLLIDENNQIIKKRILNWLSVNKLLLLLKPIPSRLDFQFKHEVILG